MKSVLKESSKQNQSQIPKSVTKSFITSLPSETENTEDCNSENQKCPEPLSECSPQYLIKLIENLKTENKQKDDKISRLMDQIHEQTEYITEHVVTNDELQEQLQNARELLDISERSKASIECENSRLQNQMSVFQLEILKMEDKLKEVEYESKRTVALEGPKTRRPSYTECVPLEYKTFTRLHENFS